MTHEPQTPEFIEPLDLLIRAGRIREARSQLSALLTSRQLPRQYAPWLAAIARRTGQHELALRLLHRWVRPPERSRLREPTAHERLEYGAALVNLYAHAEAREVLSGLDGQAQPEAYFFQALGCIAQWDHLGAIGWLERFLSQNRIDPYRRVVGQVNLALALLLAQKWDEARVWISKNIQEAQKKSSRLLLLNSLECLTHLEYISGTQASAKRALGETLELALDSAAQIRDTFFVEKWRILIAHRARPSRYWLNQARALQTKARVHRDFETARAIDFHLGRDRADPHRLARVYFGSPFPAYRLRIAETARDLGIEIPATWAWLPSTARHAAVMSHRTGPIELAQATPARGLLPQLLAALCGDHYRPIPLLALHERLYPGVHFNPRSSRDQMHQALKRLREHFTTQSLALNISEHGGAYRIEGHQKLVLSRDPSRFDNSARIARGLLGVSPFASSQLAAQLEISKPTAVARIHEWIQEGALSRVGSGPATRYRFVA